MADAIERALAAKKPTADSVPEPEGDKFYSILVGEGEEENYLEFRIREGLRACLAYDDLNWFSYDPDLGQLEMSFGLMHVTVKGRGMGERLFDGFKKKRVAWIKEADTEMQDHPKNKLFIEEILIDPFMSAASAEGGETPLAE